MTVLLAVSGNPGVSEKSFEFLSRLHESGLTEFDEKFNNWDTFKTMLPESFNEHLDVFYAIFKEKEYSANNTILGNIQLKNNNSLSFNIVEAYFFALFNVRNNYPLKVDPFESVDTLILYFVEIASLAGTRFDNTAERIRRNIKLMSDNVGFSN